MYAHASVSLHIHKQAYTNPPIIIEILNSKSPSSAGEMIQQVKVLVTQV